MAKAYMTSLPNTTDTQKGLVKVVDSPKVPAMDYRSGFRDVGTAIDNTNQFLDTFSKMKYEGFQADLDRLELEHLHQMQDAKDPCELEALNEEWKKKYDSALKDDVWSRSYYKSKFYKNWQDRNQQAQQKIYYAKQHEFAEICATETLNKMAETASLLENPNDVEQYIQNGEAMLRNIKHLSADSQHKLMASFYKDTVSRLYNSDPNKAVAFLDSVGNRYDAYGVSSEEIRNKADAYNKAKAKEARNEQARMEKLAMTQDKMLGLSLAQKVATGKIDSAEATKIAGELSPIAWNEYRKATPKNSKDSKIDYADVHKAVENLPSVDDESFDEEVAKVKLEHSDWNASQLSRFNDLTKSLKDTIEKNDKSNPITVEDVYLVEQVKNGELVVSDKDIQDYSHGNSQLAKDFFAARSTFKVNQEKEIAEKNKKISEEEKVAKKEKEQQKKDKSKIALGKINMATDEDIATVVSENVKDLTPEDWSTAGSRISEARRRIEAKREKAQGEQKKRYEENIKTLDKAQKDKNFNNVYDILTENPDAYSDSQINEMNVSQEQKKQLKEHKESSSKNKKADEAKLLKEQRLNRANNMKDEVVKAWEKGNIVTGIDDFLQNYPYGDSENRQSLFKWITDGNDRIMTANWSSVKNEFYKYNQSKKIVSNSEIEDFIEQLPENQTGKNYQEMYEELSKIRDGFNTDKSSLIKTALDNFDTVWGTPLYAEETPLEKTKKQEAKNMYHNLLLNQDTADKIQKVSSNENIMSFVSKFKPTESEIIGNLEESNIVKQTLNSLRDKYFDYNKESKKWETKKQVDFSETVFYRNLLKNALSKNTISKKEYDEQMSPISELTAYSLQKLEKEPNKVLGAIYLQLKTKLGENYNPAVMISQLDEATELLGEMNVNPSAPINKTFWSKVIRTPNETLDTNRLAVLAVCFTLGIKQDDSKFDALTQGGKVIKLGD